MATSIEMGINSETPPASPTEAMVKEAEGWCAEPEYAYGDGHSGIGWYCWESEYPDEGSFYLGAAQPAPGARGE